MAKYSDAVKPLPREDTTNTLSAKAVEKGNKKDRKWLAHPLTSKNAVPERYGTSKAEEWTWASLTLSLKLLSMVLS